LLVSTSQAASTLGISLQGVHYRIKKGLLKSKKQDGKTFVYMDKKLQEQTTKTDTFIEDLLKAKDEQINLLNSSLEWMKEQHTNEIQRLNDNQDKMMNVFKSEIELLKQAYTEMNILHKTVDKTKLLNTKEETEIMNLKDFFIYMKRYNKSNKEIKSIIVSAIKQEDKRFVFYKKSKKNIYI
jgi:ABC-type phosphate transport system auxiliary subunit